MDDKSIIALFFDRSEDAIAKTDEKYGNYCFRIAHNILENREDAEESVNDTYMAAWNAIPPHKPSVLSTFLGKITRRIAIDRWRARNAEKRGGGETALALEELRACATGLPGVEEEYQRKEAIRVYLRFLDMLPAAERNVFLCRYWYVEPVSAIAEKFGFTQSKVKTMLHRTRAKLQKQFKEEGLL